LYVTDRNSVLAHARLKTEIEVKFEGTKPFRKVSEKLRLENWEYVILDVPVTTILQLEEQGRALPEH